VINAFILEGVLIHKYVHSTIKVIKLFKKLRNDTFTNVKV